MHDWDQETVTKPTHLRLVSASCLPPKAVMLNVPSHRLVQLAGPLHSCVPSSSMMPAILLFLTLQYLSTASNSIKSGGLYDLEIFCRLRPWSSVNFRWASHSLNRFSLSPNCMLCWLKLLCTSCPFPAVCDDVSLHISRAWVRLMTLSWMVWICRLNDRANFYDISKNNRS